MYAKCRKWPPQKLNTWAWWGFMGPTCKIKILKCQNLDQAWLLPLDIDTCAYHQHVHDEDRITQTYSGMPG